jgi:hypothetical protein
MTTPQPVEQPEEERSRRIERLVERTQQAVLVSVEEILRRQMEPFLEHARLTLLATLDEMVNKYGQSALVRTREATLETVEEVLNRQIEPFLERYQRMLVDGLENAAVVQKSLDMLGAGVKRFAKEMAVEVLEGYLPSYAHRFGRRVLGYAVGGTLVCLAVIFLLLGGVLGLQAVGVPPFATYLAGGAIAGGVALVLLKMSTRPLMYVDDSRSESVSAHGESGLQTPRSSEEGRTS